jgi:PKD repeat protein
MSGYAYTAVGNISSPFTGGLDGNNYMISNLYISAAATNNQGLFGVIGPGTLCSDIQLYNFNISGKSYVGGLFGQVIMSSTSNATCYITNVDISYSQITGDGSYVGSLGGLSITYANLDVSYCDMENNTISGGYNCGGLMGNGATTNSQATIANCVVANCIITAGGHHCGGLMGYGTNTNSHVSATNCLVANCIITAGGHACGGLMGHGAIANSQATIANCVVANCIITAGDSACGGLMGFGADTNSQATATNCVVENCVMTSPTDCGEFVGIGADGSSIITLSGNVGINNIINGNYLAILDTDIYLVNVTQDASYFYVTITPPNGLAYNVSKNLFYTEASYDLIGSAWTTHSGEYSFSMPKTSGATTATAGYVAIYRNGYSDYIYWGFPTDANPIIISEIDVPTTGNTGDAISLTASAYNIETYQWQQSLNGATWTDIDGAWTPTTAGVNYIRLKTMSDDFTVYSGTAAITIAPTKPIVSFYASTPVSIAKDGSVTFIGSITLAGGDALTSYTWNFGDGSTDSSSLAPTHQYTTAGTYTVSLTAVSTYGTTTYSRSNYVSVSSQAEYVKFDNETYTSGDTATVSWNMVNTNFVDHEYTIRIFAIDDLGQAYKALTPVEISTASGEQEFATDLWAGGYMVYIYQDSYIYLEPTGFSTVISMHNLTLLITNSGATWDNYTLLTISDGVSTIAEGNTTTGSIIFPLQTGTYTITATTDGKTAISTTIDLTSDDLVTFDWVTGASKGTTTGAGSSYASTFVTFRVMDSTYGLPISGVMISTRGVAATNPFEWFANLFGTAWGATILGTNQSGITDDNGVITFAMFPGVRYILTISHPLLDEPITQTFTPSSLSTEYPIYLDVIDPAELEAETSVTTLISADVDGEVIVTYSDTSLTTTSIQMQILEKGIDGNYTLIESASAYGNASTRSFQLTDFAGTSIKIIITAETNAFGTIERVYYHTFPGPMIALGGLPASCYIWICLISAVLLAGVATFVSSYATCFIICFVEWIYWFFGWFFEIGAIPSATLLTIASVMSVAIYIGSRR